MLWRSRLRIAFVFLGALLLASCATNADVVREAAQGHTAVVQTLLGQGADGNAIDRDGKTALMLAAFEGHAATVQVLLANGVQANTKDKQGATALMLAASQGHTDAVQALLAKGADANLQNSTGQTALMLAVVGGHGGVIQVLLLKGADVELKNQAGQTALTIAQARGVAHLLEQNQQAKAQAPASPPIVKDASPPRIIVVEPASLQKTRGLVVADSELRLAGIVADGTGTPKLFINGTPASLDPQGRFEHTIRLAAGDNVIVFKAVDARDRTTDASFTIRNTGARRAPSSSLTAPNLPRFGRYHALVIGNNAYEYLPKLQTAIHDAQTVASTLRDSYGFNVTLLLDATRDKIILAFDKMRTALAEDDNLLVYYAGHGTLDKEAERGYWLPVNAQPDTRVNWLSTTEITDTLKAMTARHVLVVADSCYSGTLLRDAGEGLHSGTAPEMFFLRMAQKRSRTALTSGGIEPVMDGGGGSHSVFSRAFLTTLEENRGILDGQQLSNQIKRIVITNSPQTPEYSDIRYAGHDGGDFLFVRTP